MKKLLALMLAMVMVFSLAACGKTDAPATDEPAAEEAAEFTPLLGSEPVEITFWHCASDEAGTLMDKYIEEYNSTNDKQVTVKAIYQGQYSDATTLLKTLLSAENYEELPDIMQMDATGKVDYFNSGKAFTVTDAVAMFGEDIQGDYLEAALGNWQFSGAQLGVPFATSTSITMYNADMLKAAGWDHCPDTFADIIALSKDMKAAGIEAAPFATVPNTPTLANWIGQLGSYVVDNENGSEGTATALDCIDNGALAEFLTEWKAMYDEGALVNEALSTSEFVAGDLAIFTTSSSNINAVLGEVNGNFEVGAAPYLRVNDKCEYGATVNGSCLVMFDSEDQLKMEAAWDFLKFLSGADVQSDFAIGTGYIPGNKAALESDDYSALLEETPIYAVGPDQLAKTPLTMKSITVGPSADFYYAIMQCSSDMLANGMSVDEAVENMQTTLQDLLDQYLRNNQ